MGLPTPEELGKQIERGEMTEAEAAEIMAERARRRQRRRHAPASGPPSLAAAPLDAPRPRRPLRPPLVPLKPWNL